LRAGSIHALRRLNEAGSFFARVTDAASIHQALDVPGSPDRSREALGAGARDTLYTLPGFRTGELVTSGHP
jgi:hypothetical protein